MPLEDRGVRIRAKGEPDPYITITIAVYGDYPFVTASRIEIDITRAQYILICKDVVDVR